MRMSKIHRGLLSGAAVFGIVALTAGTASANGFVLSDHGARGTGRANAIGATVKGAQSMQYNPAGMALTEGIELYFGGNLILPSDKFKGDDGINTEVENHVAATLHAYAAGRITDWLSVGLGFNTPFGLTLEWPEDSPGRDVVRKVSLATFFIMPEVAFNLNKWVPGLSIGGGVDLVPATVELNRDVVFGNVVGQGKLAGDAFGVSGRIGAQYRPDWLKGLSMGVTYRGQVKLDFEGDSDFDIADPFRGQLPPDGDIATTVDLPQSVVAGVAYRVIDDLEFELDINWFDWSSFNELNVDLVGPNDLISPRNWEDTITVRVGAEYNLRDIGLDLRLGYMYDPTPVPSETLDFVLPDVDRHNITAGASYAVPGDLVFVDLGLLYVLPTTRRTGTAPFMPVHKGEFEVSVFVASLTVGFNFGKPEETATDAMPSDAHEPAPAADPEPAPEPEPVAEPAPEPEPEVIEETDDSDMMDSEGGDAVMEETDDSDMMDSDAEGDAGQA